MRKQDGSKEAEGEGDVYFLYGIFRGEKRSVGHTFYRKEVSMKAQAIPRRFGWGLNRLRAPSWLTSGNAVRDPEFRVLSISGGGFMGLYTALVLAEMEERAGRPLGSCFDLIAGTSIGGIIALALAQGVPMKDVAQSFEERGAAIFPRKIASRKPIFQMMDAIRQISGAKYDGRALRETICEFLPEDLRMCDIDRRVVIPAVNLTRGAPHVFRTRHAPHAGEEAQWLNAPAIDVALATSAAPTLLPIHEIAGEYFSDGGTFANSPDLVALHEAETLCGIDPKRVRMLSVGTSSAGYHFPDPDTRSFGLKEWAEDQRIVKVTLAAQQNHARSVVQGRLGKHYLRIDEEQTPEEASALGLDVADEEACALLRGIALRTTSRLSAAPKLNEFLAHDAPKLEILRA
jgi:uncharacterized protein